jgi:predicted RNA binding protein YcfA (HicA-like mRNA interferase family)
MARRAPFALSIDKPTLEGGTQVARPAKPRRLLEQNGWRMTRGGKHVVKMEKNGFRPITLPRHRGETYGRGLTSAILNRQA